MLPKLVGRKEVSELFQEGWIVLEEMRDFVINLLDRLGILPISVQDLQEVLVNHLVVFECVLDLVDKIDGLLEIDRGLGGACVASTAAFTPWHALAGGARLGSLFCGGAVVLSALCFRAVRPIDLNLGDLAILLTGQVGSKWE